MRTATSTKSDLEFHYDAMGNRVCKIVKPRDGSSVVTQDEWTYTYYVRDASGNVISVYDRKFDHPNSKFYDQFTLEESHLYGSSRVGIKNDTTTIASKQYSFVAFNGDGTFDTSSPIALTTVAASTTTFTHEMRRKSYELSNHLGNVLVTVSDARTATNNSGTVVAFSAVVISASDYYAFGSSMVGRTISGDYRYAFNGKEKDDEITGNSGDSYDFGARMYNDRLGRWLSRDALSNKYPSCSPYCFAANSPIVFVDANGLWVGRLSPDGGSVWFVAEEGDNMQTLSVQLGVSYDELLTVYPDRANWNFSAGTAYAFAKVPQVQAMNAYLSNDEIDQTNCSNAAMGVNGIAQDNAWPQDAAGADADPGGVVSTECMSQANQVIETQATNIPESQASIGDVVTYQSSDNYVETNPEFIYLAGTYGWQPGTPQFCTFAAEQATSDSPQHYAVVLLKTKDGQGIQQVLEKPGQQPATISNYPPSPNDQFVPAPDAQNNNAGGSPVYTIDEQK